MTLNKEQFEKVVNSMSERLKPCPICGGKRRALAVFSGNDSDDVIGWIQACPECDKDKRLPVLGIEELDWE